jgi:hypothetical protein
MGYTAEPGKLGDKKEFTIWREKQEQAFALWLIKFDKLSKISCIVFHYMKILDCFMKKSRLLACSAHELWLPYKTSLLACSTCIPVRYMWYMPMHLAARQLGGSLYCFSLFESICLFYKTSLLACNHF